MKTERVWIGKQTLVNQSRLMHHITSLSRSLLLSPRRPMIEDNQFASSLPISLPSTYINRFFTFDRHSFDHVEELLHRVTSHQRCGRSTEPYVFSATKFVVPIEWKRRRRSFLLEQNFHFSDVATKTNGFHQRTTFRTGSRIPTEEIFVSSRTVANRSNVELNRTASEDLVAKSSREVETNQGGTAEHLLSLSRRWNGAKHCTLFNAAAHGEVSFVLILFFVSNKSSDKQCEFCRSKFPLLLTFSRRKRRWKFFDMCVDERKERRDCQEVNPIPRCNYHRRLTSIVQCKWIVMRTGCSRVWSLCFSIRSDRSVRMIIVLINIDTRNGKMIFCRSHSSANATETPHTFIVWFLLNFNMTCPMYMDLISFSITQKKKTKKRKMGEKHKSL